jgi:putative FmdB family regulatory protein
MPTYEYACEACGIEFEREQRISDSALKKCPECGKLKLKRLIGGSSFVLKGGGWYADLYHKGSSSKGSDKGDSKKTDSSKPSGKSPSTKGDKKANSSAPKSGD